jgi:cell division protein FtsL
MRWRIQFGVRTLLLASLLLPPAIALLCERFSEARIWRELSAAKQRRDQRLVEWRIAYEASNSGSSSAAESKARQDYFSARQDVEAAVKTIYARHGNSEQEVIKAMQAQRKR